MAATSPAGAEPLWVFFKENPSRTIDDPLSDYLIREIEQTGACIRTMSRYFNALSVDWDGEIRILESCVRAGFIDGGSGYVSGGADALSKDIHASMVNLLGELIRKGMELIATIR